MLAAGLNLACGASARSIGYQAVWVWREEPTPHHCPLVLNPAGLQVTPPSLGPVLPCSVAGSLRKLLDSLQYPVVSVLLNPGLHLRYHNKPTQILTRRLEDVDFEKISPLLS